MATQRQVIQAQAVLVGGGGQFRHDHVLGIQQVAVAFDIGRVAGVVETVVAGAEDAVDVVDVGVGQGQAVQRFQLAEHAVVGLLVLPPGDATDEALVVQVDALAAEHGVAQRMVVAQQGLVDFAAVRVGDHRVVALAVARAVVAGVADAADVVGLDQRREAVPLTALEADAGAQGLGVGVVQRVVLVDVLIAVAQVEDRLAVADQCAQRLAGESGVAEGAAGDGQGQEG
ncbi:hypothetical protein D3C72_1615910 [compost metagenome]